MEQNLCDFCQSIPFREQDYTGDTQGLPFIPKAYRAQEQHGKMKLLRKGDSTDEWVLASPGDYSLICGYKRTDVVPGLPSITANAAAGCDFCKFLLASGFKDTCIGFFKGSPENSALSFSLKYDCSVYDDKFCLRKLILSAAFGREHLFAWAGKLFPDLELSYAVMAEEDDSGIEFLGIANRPTIIPCDGIFPTIKQWITACVEDCHQRPLNGDVPTRLLDLSNQGTIRLVDCRGKTNLSEWGYVALSHCWGEPDRPPLRTTQGLLDEWSRHIPFESLPRNYQDAITVTRGLGLKYLWIDSLCIIQDSLMDWERESSRMHEVYRNACLTLIAASGNSCHDGFLDLRPEPRVRLRYKSSTHPFSTGTYSLYMIRNVRMEIERSSWNRRGWTFQEEKFSERKLYFTAHDIAYRCMNIRSFRSPEREVYSGKKNKGILEDCQYMQKVDPTDFLFFHIFNVAWNLNVEDYTSRILTNPKDRLPALSAMAKSFNDAVGQRYEYLAGLWTENLHLWLLWRCEGVPECYSLLNRIRYAEGSELIAPSWSWASQSSPVSFWLSYKFTSESCRVQIVEHVIEADGSDPYGRVKNGSLQLLGRVRKVPEVSLENINPSMCGFGKDLNLDLFLDWREPDWNLTNKNQQSSFTASTNLLMLLIAETEDFMAGLLLHSPDEDGVYFRVGVFYSRGDSFRTKASFDDYEMCTVKMV